MDSSSHPEQSSSSSDSLPPPSAPPARNAPSSASANVQWANNKARCYIGNLTPEISEGDLRTHFANYNPKKCDMKGGYAFIEFEGESDAQDAVKYMDGSSLLERRIQVRPAGDRREKQQQRGGDERSFDREPREFQRGGPQTGPRQAYGFRVEVENLAPRTSWQDLKDFGRRAGPSVKYADVWEGPSGKCGVISWGVEADMRAAVTTLHEQSLDGNVIRVYEDKTNSGPRGVPTKQYGPPQQQGGGGGGGGSSRGYQEREQYGGPPRDSREYSRDPRDSYRDPRDSYRSDPRADPRAAYDPRDSYARRRSPSPRRAPQDEYRRRRSPSPRRGAGAEVAASALEGSSSSSRHHSSSHRSSHRSRSRSRERESRYRRSPERSSAMPLSPPPAPAADPYARRGSSRSRSPPRHDPYAAPPAAQYREERRR